MAKGFARTGLMAVAAAWAAAGLAGCGGGRTVVGRLSLVESIPAAQPDWYGRPGRELDGKLYFAGMVEGRADYALGMREARAEAEKGLAEMVRQRIRVEFGSAVEGDNRAGDEGRYARDVIAKVTERVALSGTRLEDQYARRFEESTREGVRTVWQLSALVSVPREEYLEARRAALQDALGRARAERNEAARRLLERVFERLDGEAAAAAPGGRK